MRKDAQPLDFPIIRTEPAYLKTVWLRMLYQLTTTLGQIGGKNEEVGGGGEVLFQPVRN